LGRNPPHVTDAIAAADPRIASLRVQRSAIGCAIAVAAVTDGYGIYVLTLALSRQGRRWLVTGIGEG
jgi:hypothetical protein